MSPVTRVRAGLVAVVLPLFLILAACSGGETPAGEPASPASTPLSAFDTAGLVVSREPFCDRLGDDAVETVAGSPVAEATSYDNGDQVRIARGVKDVAHEFACSWTTESGTVVRAWVFAPPVNQARARLVRRSITAEPGCRPIATAPDFGARSVAVRCGSGGKATVSFQGLFGDAWLACSARSSGADRGELADLADRWCVAVINATSTD